jgi:hypothetical protein
MKKHWAVLADEWLDRRIIISLKVCAACLKINRPTA